MIYRLSYINANGGRLDFSLKGGIVVGKSTGFTENFISLSESQGMMQIGSTIQGQTVEAKNIVIEGEIMGPTAAKRKMMLEVVSPLIPARLLYNDEWEIAVVPTVTPIIEKYPANARYQFTLRAAYPYWRKQFARNTTIAGLAALFRFPWNISVPFRFSELVKSLFGNVVNNGNVPAKFTVYFTARSKLKAPKIVKVTTGEFIRIDKELEAGEAVTVDMTGSSIAVTSVLAGITNNYFGYLDMDSTLFKLDVGDNIIRYDADENIDGLSVRIAMHDTIAGVY